MSNKNYISNVIIVTTIISFLVAFISSATAIALPSIAKFFSMNIITQNWVANIFLLTIAVFSLPSGKLVSRFGLKKSLVIGTIIFLIGSIGSIFSFTGEILLFFRFIHGIGSAILNVAAMALTVQALPSNERGKGLGINVAGVYIGLSSAPFIGGFLTYNFSWQSIYAITIPVMIIVLYLLFNLKEEWKDSEILPFDIKGSICYALAIVFFIYGFTIINTSLGIILSLIGIILLILFVLLELKEKFPLLDMHLFKNIKFLSSNLASLISYLATFVITYILNYHFQYILGLNSQVSGIILIICPVFMAIMSPFSGKLSDKIHPQKLAALGMMIVTLALFILCFLDETTPIYVICIAAILQGIGYGLFSTPNTNAIMSSVPPKETASASAVLSSVRVIGQTLSLGLFTVIFAVVMGSVPIVPSNYNLLILSSRSACIISTVLCVIAAICCIIGIKSKDNFNT